MKKRSSRGSIYVEFAFVLLVLVPLIIGTMGIGINLISALQVTQLARDAGHMWARGIDFSRPGNKVLLARIGEDFGLQNTTGISGTTTGNAVVILTSVTYVDPTTCAVGGAVDASGNPSGCTNLGKWVFTQRIVMGNRSLRASAFGDPSGVTIDSNTGKIPATDYVKKSGALASFNTPITNYKVVNGNVSGLPSGQVVYISEAAIRGFDVPGVITNAVPNAFGFF